MASKNVVLKETDGTDIYPITLSGNIFNSNNISVESRLQKLEDALGKIGSIYMSTVDVSPANYFGGTWERIEGKFLFSANSSFPAGSSGGSKDAVIVAHSHSVITTYNNWQFFSKDGIVQPNITAGWHRGITTNESNIDGSIVTNTVGSNATNANMPPYLAIYMWKRIA